MPDRVYPNRRALMPAQTPALVAATLRSLGDLQELPRYQGMATRHAYFDGAQYDDRSFNWDGSYCGMTSAVGDPVFPPDHVPSFTRRKMPMQIKPQRRIVSTLTSLVFGEGHFPTARCEDDPKTEDFLAGVVEAGRVDEVMGRGRNLGGVHREVAASWGWVDGLPVFEVHSARWTFVLDWHDFAQKVPRHVVKVWPVEVKTQNEQGLLAIGEGWMAKEWRAPYEQQPGAERLYRYVPPSKAVGDAGRWELLDDRPASRCRVAWMTNDASLEGDSGVADFDGEEGLIDGANMTLSAGVNGCALNADPTLCIDLPAGGNDGGQVKKGGFNTINTTDAKYLEISGASVTAALGAVDRLRHYIAEDASVPVHDPEKVKGAVSGAAMKQQDRPTTLKVAGLRRSYGDAGLVRLLQGILEDARELLDNGGPDVPAKDELGRDIVDDDGRPVMTRAEYEFRIPPRVVRKAKKQPDGTMREEVVERVPRDDPGKGTHIVLVWPDLYPDTPEDQLAKLQAIAQGNGGAPVMSTKTGIELASPITKVQDAEQELADILAQQTKLSDAKAGSLGMMQGGEVLPGTPPEKPKAESAGASGET